MEIILTPEELKAERWHEFEYFDMKYKISSRGRLMSYYWTVQHLIKPQKNNHLDMSIQDFFKKYPYRNNPFIFYICSYVPDIEARKLTAKCRYFYSYYPPDEEKKRLPKR